MSGSQSRDERKQHEMLFTFRACSRNNIKEDSPIFFPQQYFITRLKVRKVKSNTNWEQQVVRIKEVGTSGWKNKNIVSNLITSPGYRNVERIVAADFRVRAASPFLIRIKWRMFRGGQSQNQWSLLFHRQELLLIQCRNHQSPENKMLIRTPRNCGRKLEQNNFNNAQHENLNVVHAKTTTNQKLI